MTIARSIICGSADVSECGRYRYALERWWMFGTGTVLFVMLNPSTADAVDDDPTVRRCISFAQRWGHQRLIVCNLFAWRATDPRELRTAADPVGPMNDERMAECAGVASLILCAWGNHGAHAGRDKYVREALYTIRPLHHLGLTGKRQPRHPLYLRGDLKPLEWESVR